ncbi:MAG: hypothetical protein JW854_14640 [Actinobacteria bacterium]|nr:hypothetical protein [Actinomycetota bacterium]
MKPIRKIHERDTMTSEERIRACIRLQEPDRVPVAPLFYYFVAHYNGMTYTDLANPRNYYQGLARVFDDLGPWDANYFINAYDREVFAFIIPMKMLEPGYELPPDVVRQFLEEEVMKEEDYEWILEVCKRFRKLSYLRFFVEKLMPGIWEDIPYGWRSYAATLPMLLRNIAILRKESVLWERKGVTPFYSLPFEAAFDDFSLARGLINFSRDLKKRPQTIAAAAEALTDSYAYLIKRTCILMGIKRAEVFVHRSSNDFISPKQFRELSLPSLKALIERLAEDGIPTILHCDGCWDLNLEELRKLPAGCAVFQGDGTTDIFKVKEVIGDRVCIYGDVPANLLSLGSPSEVDEYCHRLIEEVGKGGGFILGSGCELAPNAKPENVKAMCKSVVKYGYYGVRCR